MTVITGIIITVITIFIGITTPIVITITEVHSQLLPNLYLHIPQINAVASINLFSRELTYPTCGKQKSSTQKCLFCGFFWWYVIVPRRGSAVFVGFLVICDMFPRRGRFVLKHILPRWILNPHLQVFEIQEQGRISQAMATFYWWAAGLDEFHVLMSWRKGCGFWVESNDEKMKEKNLLVGTCWCIMRR